MCVSISLWSNVYVFQSHDGLNYVFQSHHREIETHNLDHCEIETHIS
jgi:hypothetical protein